MGLLYFAAFLIGGTASFLLAPLTIWLAKLLNVVDQPSERKVHRLPIPRLGGLAVCGGVVAALAGVYLGFPSFRELLAFRHVFLEKGEIATVVTLEKQIMGIVAGLTAVLILGIWDDKRGVPAVPKLLIQIIASYVALDYGVRIFGLRLPFGTDYLQFPLLISQIVTVFWIIGFMNAMNLADGLDGLAAGLAAIAAGTFLAVAIIQAETKVVFITKQLQLAAFLSAALCGACLGFLPCNFAPARVFLGDGGALSIGFLLGAITVIGTLKTTAVFSFMIPVIVVALPVLDVSLAIIRRFRKKAGITQPDREHLHHQMLARGWTTREVVLLVYVLTLILSVFAIVLSTRA